MTATTKYSESSQREMSGRLNINFQTLAECVQSLTSDLQGAVAHLDRICDEAAWSAAFCVSCASAWETGDVSAMEAERDRLMAQLNAHQRPRLRVVSEAKG